MIAAYLAVVAAAASAPPLGFTVDCANKAVCEMTGTSTPGGPGAVPGSLCCIAASGLPGPYTMARRQHIIGACSGSNGTRPKIYGDVYIVSSGSHLQGVDVAGQVVVMGDRCDHTQLIDVHAHFGVVFRPRRLLTSINVSGSTVSGVTASARQVAKYPVAFAAAAGSGVEVTCAAGTTVVVQPGQPNAVPVGLTLSKCAPAIDLHALFGIFGSAIERVVYDVGPTDDETASRKILTSLVTIFGSATAFQLLLLA